MAETPDFLNARVVYKVATEAEWDAITLEQLIKGEFYVYHIEGDPNKVINIKVGDGVRQPKDLPYFWDASIRVPFFGSAGISDTPTPSEGDGFWIVTEAGVYDNFGDVELPENSLGVITRLGDDYQITVSTIDFSGFLTADDSTNLFDSSVTRTQYYEGMPNDTPGIILGARMNAAGNLFAAVTSFVSDYIPLKGGSTGTLYTAKTDDNVSTPITNRTNFNSSKVVQSSAGSNTPHSSFTTTSYFTRISVSSQTRLDSLRLVEGSDASVWEPAGKIIQGDIKVTEAQISPSGNRLYFKKGSKEITQDNLSFSEKTVNLFIKDTSLGYTPGTYIDASTGNTVENTGLFSTNWILIPAGQKLSVSHTRQFALYDTGRTRIAGGTPTTLNVPAVINPEDYSITTDCYYRQGVSNTHMSIYMAVLGETLPTEYVKGGWLLKNTQLEAITNSEKPVIHIWGSSSVAGSFPSLLQTASGRTISAHGYAGQRTPEIRDAFLASTAAVKALPQIFWVSRNSSVFGVNGFVDTAIEDVKRMIAALNHDKYIIIGPQTRDNGTPPENIGDSMYDSFVAIETELTKAFGARFLNIREALANSWNYLDLRITADFTQPAVGSNVVVSMNREYTVPVQGAQRIKIGWRNEFDIYTVISTTETSWTLRLDVSGRIASGGTVSNLVTSLGAIAYLTVVGEKDDFDRQNGRWPYYLRQDDIHLTDFGYSLCCPATIDRINQFGL